jgi:hypothetical protein
MSNKSEPKKKAGQDTKKKRRNMREAVAARQQSAKPEGISTDEVDKIKFKRGSDGDRTVRQRGAVGPAARGGV